MDFPGTHSFIGFCAENPLYVKKKKKEVISPFGTLTMLSRVTLSRFSAGGHGVAASDGSSYLHRTWSCISSRSSPVEVAVRSGA